jgi:hypothetical protein
MIHLINKYFKTLVLSLCFLTIVPYFLACRFIHPFFDDFLFAHQISGKGVLDFIRYFYLNWSGRYSEVILMVCTNTTIQDGSNVQYALFGVFTLTAVFFSILYIVRVFLKSYCSVYKQVVAALLIFAFYLVFMPELFSAFYWHCSSYYQLCLSFLLLNIGMLVNLFKEEKGWSYKLMVIFLNIFIAGFSEITIFSFSIFYLSIIIHRYSTYKKVDTFWLLLFLIFVSFAAINICSPGNFVRMQTSNEQPQFFFCSLRAVYDLILFHGVYLFFKTPFLIVCFLFANQAKSYVQSTAASVRIFRVNPWYSLVVTLFIFYLQHALSLYAAGYTLQGRVYNFSIFLFYIAIVYNLMVILYHFSAKMAFDCFKIPFFVQKIMVLLLLFLFNMSDNNRLLWGDLSRELPSFHKELCERYELIENAKKNGATEVEVPAVKAIPKLYIFGEAARCKSSIFVNEEQFLIEVERYFQIHVRVKQ